MIVVNTQDTIHSIYILPRYYKSLTSNIDVYFTNEDTRKDINHNLVSDYVDDGELIFKTDANFKENATYRVKIVDNDINEVVFRGKIFATKQNKQNYLINE